MTNSQRISCEPEDSGFGLFSQTLSDGTKVLVFLDGVEVDKVITADPGRGEIERFVTDDKGDYVRNAKGDEVLRETLQGAVRWEAVPC